MACWISRRKRGSKSLNLPGHIYSRGIRGEEEVAVKMMMDKGAGYQRRETKGSTGFLEKFPEGHQENLHQENP